MKTFAQFLLIFFGIGFGLNVLGDCWRGVSEPFADKSEKIAFEKMLIEAEARAEALRKEIYTLRLQEPREAMFSFDDHERALIKQQHAEWLSELRRLQSRLDEADARARKARVRLVTIKE